MTLRQLRCLCEVVRCKLNISVAARSLGASQPAVSQQLRLLEDGLRSPIFLRTRNRLVGLTQKGEEIVIAAQEVLAGVSNLETVARAPQKVDSPVVRLASTYAQARYRLPAVIFRFKRECPRATIHIVQRNDEKFWELVHVGRADIAIATNPEDLPKSLLKLPCEQIRRSLIAPRGHPLLKERILTLAAIARYPLITTDEHLPGPQRIIRALQSAGLTRKIEVTATNEDVVKACIASGLGVAILSSIVFDAKRDGSLGATDVTSLLEPSITNIIVRRDVLQQEHIVRFIQCFTPIWTREAISRALHDQW